MTEQMVVIDRKILSLFQYLKVTSKNKKKRHKDLKRISSKSHHYENGKVTLLMRAKSFSIW